VTLSDRRGGESPSLPLAAVAGQATFDGCLAVLDVPRESLVAMMPPGIALPDTASSSSQCLLAFGEQRDSTAFVGGVSVPWGIRYHELMVAVPCLPRWGRPDAALFVLGMVCDAWWAVWNGNAYYGFQKDLAAMGWDGKRFVVSDHETGRTFDAVIGPGSTASRRGLTWIERAAALPVLGHHGDNRFVQSRFEWDFRQAAVEPAALHLALGSHFRPLPMRGEDICPDRVYRVRDMRWRLSWPMPLLR
jgi:hypothetical protein